MQNLHRNLLLPVATVFLIEGAALAAAFTVASINGNNAAGLITVLMAFTILVSFIVVARVNPAGESSTEQYVTTKDGYVSIVDLLDRNDDTEAPYTDADEEFKQVVSDIDDSPHGGVYTGEIEHPVFDVDTSTPTYDDPTPTHALVLVGHQENEVELAGELTSNQFKAPELPAMPSRKPSGAPKVGVLTLDMSDFLSNPLNDPEYLTALTDARKKIEDGGVLRITGKSYGLGARGVRIEGQKNVTDYNHNDVKKMILKFLSKPTV